MLTLTDEQVSLNPQQAEFLGITPTPQLTTLSPEQTQALGITPTPQPITLSPEQVQALGITPTPQPITLSPEQAQALGIIPTPEPITLSPEQTQALGITPTPQPITLSPEQVQALGITPTHEPIILTPEQAQALRVSLTPQQQEISFSPQQAQALGLTLTPQQAQVQKIYLTPQQAQGLGLTLSPQQAKTLKISLTPDQAHSLGITLTIEQTKAQRINLTPQQAEDLGITLTPEQAQDLGVSLTPQQQEISFSPQQAQALGLTLTPQQAQVQKIYLTPQQAQGLGLTLSPQQAKALKISLTPDQAHSLGITLTVDQAKAQRINLTPQQAEDLGITLTPEQAQALGIAFTPKQAEALEIIPSPIHTPEPDKERSLSLTPEQVQALGISFPPKETQSLGIYLTSKQALNRGITLTASQAKVKKISLTPEQAQALGITFTLKQAKAQRISLTPEQAQALGVILTPEQVQAHRIILTPEQAQALGITLTPQQAQVLGIPFTPEQAQAQYILPPKKFQELDAPLTYKQAEVLRSHLFKKQLEDQRSQRHISKSIQMPKPTVASKQTQTIEISLTTQLSQESGAPLSKRKETELEIFPLTTQLKAVEAPLSKRKETELGIFPRTPKQTQAVGGLRSKRKETELGIFPRTPKQTQAFELVKAKQRSVTWRQAPPLQDQLAPELTQTLVFAIALKKAQNLGVTFTSEQTQAAAVTLTSEQVAALEDALTEELAWRWEILVAPEKIQEAKQLQALGMAAAQPAQAFHVPFPLEKPTTLVPPTDRPSQRWKDSYPASIPLQASKPSLTQAPLTPTTSLGVGILPDSEKPWMSPTYRQTLTDRGQGIPAQPPAPEIPLSLRQLLAPEAPPIPEPPLGPRHFFNHRDTWPPLISDSAFPPRTPPASREVPGLVSGGSAAYKELLISRTSPFQPPAIHEQAPFSTPEQQGPLRIIPEQGFIPTISPIPLHPSTAETLPTPGRPQRIAQRSSEAKPLKPKSARALPGMTMGFEAPHAPFPIEKTQIPRISDTSGQTQVLQDSFGMQPFGIFQPYVTSSRTPRSQSPLIGEKALSREKPGIPLPSLTTQLPQTPQISTSEKGQKPWLPPIDKSWTPTPISDTREAKMMVSPLSTDEHPEDRYVVDVEAQRKNLVTLNQAAQTSGLPAQYLTVAKNLIIELLHIDTVRLGYLSRKYVAYRLIQLARNHLSKRVKAIQNTGKGYEIQNLYIMLDRIEQYQKRVMQGWTDKQKQLEQRRKQCLRSMTQFFSQLERGFKLTLSQPTPSMPSFKKIPEFTKLQRPVLELLIDDSKRSDLFKTLGQASVEAVWNADLSTSSYPIVEKAPMSTLWAQLGGYPDIPKLLQLDIQSTFRKSLTFLQSQSKKIHK
ncbi:protein FAM186A-like isoform X1 [Mastomys coucha]|uniref:protein FAM186A-like isoform X1 n=1 Tax=Mastomys coucha TaxID=35658 RepID=UPI001262846E|nr:protein FAM186A-like isoform X1 [Mastomys coucha]